jgi:hypothetical protein
MQFLLLIVIVKIALTVLGVTLGAMLIAELFPYLAELSVSSTSGTHFAVFGEWLGSALNFMAKYAQKLVDLIFSWLSVFGIDIDSGAVKDGVKDVDVDAPKGGAGF